MKGHTCLVPECQENRKKDRDLRWEAEEVGPDSLKQGSPLQMRFILNVMCELTVFPCLFVVFFKFGCSTVLCVQLNAQLWSQTAQV